MTAAVWDETMLAEVEAAANRLRPVRKPHEAGQCLPTALAAILRVPAASVPIRLESRAQDWEEWRDEVETRFGVELRYLTADECPPDGLRPWVAIVPTEDGFHAEARIGAGRSAAVCGLVAETNLP